ncbi:MAG: endonuclease/exonuclease/phosphatase family protein [Bacteroidota bacterium]
MWIKKLAALLVVMGCFTLATGQSLRVLTYNIRYDNPGDGQNSWPLRRDWLCSQVRTCSPDIFGIQEGLSHQVDYIDSALAVYHHIGVGRDDGMKKGEFSAIFYNYKKFRVLKQSSFWLSPTPGKPSKGWDAACIRICTCGLFEELTTRRQFWVFNTHLDHMGVVARKNSAVLICRKIAELNRKGLPVILTGDFNGGPESEPIRYITGRFADARLEMKDPEPGDEGTFNGFDPSKPVNERIDFVFTGKTGFSITKYHVIREYHDGKYPSDHFPVVVEMKFTR